MLHRKCNYVLSARLNIVALVVQHADIPPPHSATLILISSKFVDREVLYSVYSKQRHIKCPLFIRHVRRYYKVSKVLPIGRR